jgi:type I restriction enzyme M protein
MASPLTVVRNDYHTNKKSSTIYTPVGVAGFLFDILSNSMSYNIVRHPQFNTILDPAIGSGRLTDPWYRAGHIVIGCDLTRTVAACQEFIKGKFEDCTWYEDWPSPDLVLCNPPFNGAKGRRLYPEVFLEHIFKLFGPKIPVVLFVPMGFLKNQRRKSKRWRWLRDCGAEITSIISLPLDTFDGVEFHCEILLFNIAGVKPHYFLSEEALCK